jgi:hypothetical protein
MSAEDYQYWASERIGHLGGYRSVMRLPKSSIGDAATRAVESGCTVIAASGNRRGSIFSPSCEPSVFSVGFYRTERARREGDRDRHR